MRLLALGISALALGACSVGGGYSWNGSQSGYDQASTSSYGHSSSYGSYYGHQTAGCQVNPCSSYTPPAPQPAPCYVNPCAPVYTPPPPPVYIPPAPKPQPPVSPCYNPCSGGSYSVSPYAYGVDQGYGAQGHGAHWGGHGNEYGSGHAYSNAGYYGPTGSVRNRRQFLQFYAPNSGYSYVGGGLAQFKDDADTKSLAAQLRVGWQSDTIFGLEAEGSLGVKSDESDLVILGIPTEREDGLKNSLATFATVRSPFVFTDKVQLYSRVGYHSTRFEQSDTAAGTTTDTETSFDGLAVGGGAEVEFSDNDVLRVDYTQYRDGTDENASALSLAYLRRF